MSNSSTLCGGSSSSKVNWPELRLLGSGSSKLGFLSNYPKIINDKLLFSSENRFSPDDQNSSTDISVSFISLIFLGDLFSCCYFITVSWVLWPSINLLNSRLRVNPPIKFKYLKVHF